MHLLCWTPAHYRAENLEAASGKLRQTMLSNLLIIPQVLGRPQDELDIEDDPHIGEKLYLEYATVEIFALWDETALKWLVETYESPNLKVIRERYIAIQRQMETEPRGPRRNQLVEEASALRYSE